MKKTKFSLVNVLCILIIIIYILTIHFLPYFIQFFIENEIKVNTKLLLIVSMLMLCLNVGIYLEFLIKYFKNRSEIKKIEKEARLDINDIKYFRDIIPGGVPGILSFIFDTKNNFKRDIMATILSLEKRGYVKAVDGKINIIKKEDTLTLNEKYVLDSYKFIFSEKEFKKRWEAFVIQDCLNKNLIQRKEINNFRNPIFYIFLIGILLSWPTLFLFAITIPNFIFYISIIKNNEENKIERIRTKKGFELYVKLHGLNNFLRHFSIINDRLKNELILWDDYMIYAIIFGYEGKLTKESDKDFKRMKYLEQIINPK